MGHHTVKKELASVHVWSAACQSVLAYGCESLYLSKQTEQI